ncbi:MAG: UvrD-helicase domain-containing protein [bacterium]|nr:UvrD-helicase domain-containing protein [bacterium]
MLKASLLNSLNPSQKEAVETINGPVLVLAGAGTGKTSVITYRIANLLENWISADNIIALTFTNKAAREMKERIAKLIDEESSYKLFLGTFHAFCMKVLRAEIDHLVLHSGFAIADDIDQKGILKQVIAELDFTDLEIDLNVYKSMIGKAKQDLLLPNEYYKKTNGYFETTIAKVYEKYQETLVNQNMLDFDDILLYTVKLWQENSKVLEKYREKYKYILVDEFQDTNVAQFNIIKLLTNPKNNICVVGDDDQSIYGWRGAQIENILDFPQYFPNTKVIKLEQNYRSTNTILDAANSFISGNKRRHSKKLWSDNGTGERIKICTTENDLGEARFVSHYIYRVMSENLDYNYKDIAILYRSNHQSRLLEQELRKDHIPYRLVGSKSFYERKEIRDAIAYIKLLANIRDNQSLFRILSVPARGLGKKFIEHLRDFQTGYSNLSLCEIFGLESFIETLSSRQKTSVNEFHTVIKKWTHQFSLPGDLANKTKFFLGEIGYLNGFQKIYKNITEAETRRENVLEFINAIAEFEDYATDSVTMTDFLETFSLSDDNDKVDEEDGQNSVTLLTVHSAKGLEFPCVFIVGMEQNMFPHSRSLEEGDVDEERRLFYVALTRAKHKLILTNAKMRYKYGSQSYQMPSEFLAELPEELIEYTGQKITKVEDNFVDNAFSSFYDEFDL